MREQPVEWDERSGGRLDREERRLPGGGEGRVVEIGEGGAMAVTVPGCEGGRR